MSGVAGNSGFAPWPEALAALARPEIRSLAMYRHAPWDPAYERLHANDQFARVCTLEYLFRRLGVAAS